MDVPVDYHVWSTILEHYQRHMQKQANAMLRQKDHFVDDTEWFASRVHW